MTCPFKLPASIEHEYLKAKDGVVVVDMQNSDADEQEFILKAVNYHDRMAQAIARLIAAEADILMTRGVADYAAACAERIEALVALEAIHKELNP